METADSHPLAQTDPLAGAGAWRFPSPAPLLDRLRDCGHRELDAAVNLLAVRRDGHNSYHERLFVDRQQVVFQTLQTPSEILADHDRAPDSSGALRSGMRRRAARMPSASDIPGLYSGAGTSSGSGKPSRAARRRRMSRTTS